MSVELPLIRRKSRFTEGKRKLDFEAVTLELPIRRPNADVQQGGGGDSRVHSRSPGWRHKYQNHHS